MPASAGQRILRIVSEGIARISAAHVSAEGAGKPVRIELCVLEVVFVSQVGTILTGRLHQRSAAFPRSDKLRAEPLARFLIALSI